MKQILVLVILVTFLACKNKSITDNSSHDSLNSVKDSTLVSENEKLPIDNNSLTEYLESGENIISTSRNEKSSMDDVIIPDSVLINSKLKFRLSREKLYSLMNSPFEIEKEWETSVTYNSDNDTLEYIVFKDEGIEYIYVNGRVDFVSMSFKNKANSFNTNKITINSETTYAELCAYYPHSCKNSSFDSTSQKRVVRFYPAYNFYESTEFWAFTFIKEKINEISFVILD